MNILWYQPLFSQWAVEKLLGVENVLYKGFFNGFYICHYTSFNLPLDRGESEGRP